MTALRWFVLGVACATAATPSGAQSESRLQPWSFDVAVGVSRGHAGDAYATDVGLAGAALLGVRRSLSATSRLVVGVSGGIEGPTGGAQVCPSNSGSACAGRFPVMRSVGVLAGWERTLPNTGALRLLVGPGWFWPQPNQARSGGLQTQLDLSTPTRLRLAGVASLRWAQVRAVGETSATILGLGLGVRVQ